MVKLSFGIFVFIFSFMIANDSFSQVADDVICDVEKVYALDYTETTYKINPDNIEIIVNKPSIQSDILSAENVFVQTVIGAADRLNQLGVGGTHVYVGKTSVVDLPETYSGTCFDPNVPKRLVVIDTSNQNQNSQMIAQVQWKCGYAGIYHGFRLTIFASNLGGPISWYFSRNSVDNNLSSVLLHEWGHTYSLEHLPSTIPGIMNTGGTIYKESDVKCFKYRTGQRKYSLFYRIISSSGISAEYTYLDSSSQSVGKFASGRYVTTNNITVDSLMADTINMGNGQIATKWFHDLSTNQFLYPSSPSVETGITSDLQVWVGNGLGINAPKYIWSQIDSVSNAWETTWYVKMRTFTNNAWGSITNMNKMTNATNSVPLTSEYPPAISHLSTNETIFVWNEPNETLSGPLISIGNFNNSSVNVPELLLYNRSSLITGIVINSWIPPSIVCRTWDDLCLVAFISNDFYDANLSNPVGWKDKNVIRIGHVNLADYNDGSLGGLCTLTNVHTLPLIDGVVPKTATKPILTFDGFYFRITFRGSYRAFQKLTSYKSTDGINWTLDTSIDISANSNDPTSYSSVAPSAPSYLNTSLGGQTLLFYSRPHRAFAWEQ